MMNSTIETGTFGRGLRVQSVELPEDKDVLARMLGVWNLDNLMDEIVALELQGELVMALRNAVKRAADPAKELRMEAEKRRQEDVATREGR